MNAVKIKEGIYWVGGIDWDLRNFHGYITQRGGTYNAYLIIDEKVTLIDTVKSYLTDEMLTRIKTVIDPSKIDYIVANHVEMDHSGSIPVMRKVAPNAQIVTSPNGAKGLTLHYGEGLNFQIVKSGDTLDLGKRKLNFVLTPMVHWPDNMIGYIPSEKILFSNDSFGQHIATSERFDDQYAWDTIVHEAKKYYANIVMPFSMQVKQELKAAANLDIEIIASSHGFIYRKHTKEIINLYHDWSSGRTIKKALIVYDTMWNSTEKMAYAIQSAFEDKGYFTAMMNLRQNHISDIMTEVLTAEYICVGSPTLNNNILPTVAGFLTYLKGLSPKNRKAFAFGSYGWGGQSIGMIAEELEKCKFEVLNKYRHNYVLTDEDAENLRQDVLSTIS